MSDGSILKADKDYTKEVDVLLPEAEKIAKVGYVLLDGLDALQD